MKHTISLNAILIITVLSLLSTTSVLKSQEKNTAASTKEFAYSDPGSDPGTDPMNGSWELNTTKIDLVKGANDTKFETNNNLIVATSSWIDILKIEHTVSSSFKWDDPPKKLIPGQDLKISGTYINNEYSTPNRVLTGLKIYSDRDNLPFSEKIPSAWEIFEINKDNKQHGSEVKTGFFPAPKFYQGDNREMNIVVDCFIGKDHYVVTYVYYWNGSL